MQQKCIQSLLVQKLLEILSVASVNGSLKRASVAILSWQPKYLGDRRICHMFEGAHDLAVIILDRLSRDL
jgi:hypothetical protein